MEKSKVLIPSKVIGSKSKMIEFHIDPNNTIIYALALGFNEDQMNTKHFKFTYELADAGSVLYQSEIIDLEDKGKGTVLCIQIKIYNKEDKSLLSVITCNLFVRGLKGEGAKSVGPLKANLPKIPTGEPLKQMIIKTFPNQALYYRIGGNDPNPLHVDPDMAAMGGFDKPILHGMCTYGIAARAAYELLCDGVQENLLSFKARFTSHVIPGESLNVQFWKGSSKNSLILAVKNVERGTTVLIGEITLKNSKF
jgi:acyl dehydratase